MAERLRRRPDLVDAPRGLAMHVLVCACITACFMSWLVQAGYVMRAGLAVFHVLMQSFAGPGVFYIIT